MATAADDSLESRGLPPEMAAACFDTGPAEFELRIYVRHDGRQVRFTADDAEVEPEAVLFDIAMFETQVEAAAVAAACAAFLDDCGRSAASDGWHDVPADKYRTFLPTLLSTARKQAWSEPWTPPAPNPPEPARPPQLDALDVLPKEPRRWSRHKEARFCVKVGQGMSAKQVAADPEIRSTPEACYQRARELGISFREVPTGSITVRLALSYMMVFERAAAAKHMTRDAFIESWMRRAAADPGRFGLVAI